MSKRLHKKGIVFTIVVLFALTILFILAYSRSRLQIKDKENVVQARITTMNDFLDSFHADAERAAYISGFRTLIALEDYVSYRSLFVNDSAYYFRQIFYNGSLDDDNFSFNIMNESTFWDYQEKVAEKATEINLEFSSQVTAIDLDMVDPWTVRVQVHLLVNLTDYSHLASWNYSTVVTSLIPIFDLRDPLYSVNTLGKLPVTVRRTNFTLFVNDSANQNDTTNLQLHLNNSYYINSTSAPNFLMRFENNLHADPNGIESLVNLQVLADQGFVISDNNLSVVDYLYFGNNNTPNYCTIQNMDFEPDHWFILDRAHADIYQVNSTLEHDDC
jgi:hypothetical protein